jgi:hypothetical protein
VENLITDRGAPYPELQFTANINTATGKVSPGTTYTKVQVIPSSGTSCLFSYVFGSPIHGDTIPASGSINFEGFVYQVAQPVPSGVILTVRYTPSAYVTQGTGTFDVPYSAG